MEVGRYHNIRQKVFIVDKKFLCAESAHINVESSDVCIDCGSSKPHISGSPQRPHKKRIRRYM